MSFIFAIFIRKRTTAHSVLLFKSHITPHTSHLTPRTSHLTPHTSHHTPHTSHLTPHTSHLTPHTSHHTPHTTHHTPHTTHHTPHTTHTQEDEPCHPTSSGFAISLSMGRVVAPPNHGAAAPPECVQVASCCTCARWRLASDPLFGAPTCDLSKNRERDVAPALGGCHLTGRRNRGR